MDISNAAVPHCCDEVWCEVREKRLLQEKYSNMIYERINNTEDNPIIDDYSDVSTNNNLVRIRK